jgi:hypothetical protein
MASVGAFPEHGISDGRRWLRRQGLRQPVKAVALAGDGGDQKRMLRIRLDLAAQLADQHVDAAVEWLETPVGKGVQQCVAGDNPPWLVTKILSRPNKARVKGIISPESRARVQASRLRTSPRSARAVRLPARG